jgi:hypothetical protein
VDPALLMAVRVPDDAIDASTGARVLLNEECARVQFCHHDDDADAMWFLDTGASNHMTGDADVFAELDRRVLGTVKFGDGSYIDI